MIRQLFSDHGVINWYFDDQRVIDQLFSQAISQLFSDKGMTKQLFSDSSVIIWLISNQNVINQLFKGYHDYRDQPAIQWLESDHLWYDEILSMPSLITHKIGYHILIADQVMINCSVDCPPLKVLFTDQSVYLTEHYFFFLQCSYLNVKENGRKAFDIF